MSATWHGQKLGKQIYIQIGLILDYFNACTVAVKTAKAEHFFIQTSNNLNNSYFFFKTVKSLTENNKCIELPSCTVV